MPLAVAVVGPREAVDIDPGPESSAFVGSARGLQQAKGVNHHARHVLSAVQFAPEGEQLRWRDRTINSLVGSGRARLRGP